MGKRVSPGILAVWMALLVCLGLSIGQNISLRQRIAGLSEQLAKTFETQVGPAVADLVALDERGNQITVPVTASGTAEVVLVASGTCPFCKDTMEQWRRLEANLGAAADFTLLRLDGELKDGAAVVPPDILGPLAFTFPHRPDFEWLVPTDTSVVDFRLRYVPQTLVAKGGEIVYVKTGPLSDADLEEIESAVGGMSKLSSL